MAFSFDHPVLHRVPPPLEHIEFVTVRLPFISPFGISAHVWTCKEALLMRVDSDGLTAWSECVADPDPYYLPETTSTAAHIIRDFLLPEVKDGMTMAEILTAFRKVKGNPMAKATVENALLILLAEADGVPLHTLLGQKPARIMSGISIGIKETVDDLLAAVQEAVDKKYHRVKMKIKRGKDVAWVRAVRERFPSVKLMVDANCDFTLDDMPMLRALDGFGLMMIEQPLSYADIYQHSLVQKELQTPVCLDESILCLDDAATALALGSCRIINIKEGRVGGLIESMRIAALCQQHGVPVWSGGMDETGIGRAVNIHLQTVPGFTLPGDTSETSRYFKEDIADPPVVLDGEGYIAIPPGSGSGIHIDPDRLNRYLVSRETIR
jgi:o-succinylbenzoate synthase